MLSQNTYPVVVTKLNQATSPKRGYSAVLRLENSKIGLNTFWFIDPVTDIIGRFLSWLGSRIHTFDNVSRDTSLIIGYEMSFFFKS